jgi:hypothetical protein
MLLLYPIENDIVADDFDFGTLKNQDLNICSYNDMFFNCEHLLSKFSIAEERSGQKLIISSINSYIHPTRLKDHQFSQRTAVPNFIKIAFVNTPDS